MVYIFEDVVMPEDWVLDKLLVGNSSHHSAVELHRIVEYLPFNLQVNVVVEQSF